MGRGKLLARLNEKARKKPFRFFDRIIAIPLDLCEASRCPGTSDIDLFSYGESIVDLDAKIAHGALDLGVPSSNWTARRNISLSCAVWPAE